MCRSYERYITTNYMYMYTDYYIITIFLFSSDDVESAAYNRSEQARQQAA